MLCKEQNEIKANEPLLFKDLPPNTPFRFKDGGKESFLLKTNNNEGCWINLETGHLFVSHSMHYGTREVILLEQVKPAIFKVAESQVIQ